MKKRLISAFVALLIFIPIFLIGGFVYDAAIIILALLGLKEFLKAKEAKKELPNFINFISYIMITLVVITGINTKEFIFSIDFKIIAALFLVFLMPVALYHNQKQYSVNDAFYLIGGVFFLGTSFSLFIILRNISIKLTLYLLLITITTDSYAYIIGRLIGKHKLLESISPNKTLEGALFGTLFGTFIGVSYYMSAIHSLNNLPVVILITLFLSILGQFGDLTFSAIKRYFNKKDFSNIMPGHGGILDRLDSIIFVVLGFMFFISIL